MKNALLLCSVMVRGYGVSVVADELARRTKESGWNLHIGCLQVDEHFSGPNIHVMEPDVDRIRRLCKQLNIAVIAAQTSPYFECLPQLSAKFPTLVYEHGDPSPFFFSEDALDRENIKRNKVVNVYPHVSLVAASSYFLRQDIEWPETKVCYLGCDHVFTPTDQDVTLPVRSETAPLRVGTLMRLGAGEARYKGNQLFLDLVEHLRESTQIIPCLMGRGTTEDQTKWEAQGFEVHLNADDAEKAAYLANLDVFVSPSQWEGFNLPVVEAQALGTVGIAFDVGAHPETTPIVATCLDDAASMILAWDRHRDRLERISGQVREYVLRKYKWDNTARDFSALLDETLARGTKNTFTVPSKSRMRRLWNLIRREGLIRSGVIVAKRVRQRMGRK